MSEKRINLKELLCDKIYLTRSPAYYIRFIKLALSWYCTYLSKHPDIAERLEFTPIVFYECNKFIKFNLENNVNLIMNESEKNK